MPAAPTHSFYLFAVIGALLAWRLYARVRRMVGRQRMAAVRPWVSAIGFPLLLLFILSGALFDLPAVAALVAGTAIGVGLGIYGTRLTRFEATPAGLFYTPNAHLGIALSLLLVLRIGYRIAYSVLLAQPADPAAMQWGRSPLTLALFGMLAAYYATYAVGLLRWRARVRAEAEHAAGA